MRFVTALLSWRVHLNSNLGPADYGPLADDQPQLNTIACVAESKVSLPLFYYHILSLVVAYSAAVVQISPLLKKQIIVSQITPAGVTAELRLVPYGAYS